MRSKIIQVCSAALSPPASRTRTRRCVMCRHVCGEQQQTEWHTGTRIRRPDGVGARFYRLRSSPNLTTTRRATEPDNSVRCAHLSAGCLDRRIRASYPFPVLRRQAVAGDSHAWFAAIGFGSSSSASGRHVLLLWAASAALSRRNSQIYLCYLIKISCSNYSLLYHKDTKT